MNVFFDFKVSMRRLNHVYGLGTKHTLLRAGSLGLVASRCDQVLVTFHDDVNILAM